MTTACALVSYFYGYTLSDIEGMTLFQFRTYLHETGQIMRLLNGQAPMKRPDQINQIARSIGLTGPVK
jgi:hypothetical protein